MLPTLAPEGDFLLQLRLPFGRLLSSVREGLRPSNSGVEEAEAHPYRGKPRIGGSMFSKADQAQGTGLKVGDLVVALSPFDASRAVCKRVIGLPGDTVALDPRMRPLPMEAWRGQAKVTSQATDKRSDDQVLDSKLVKFQDVLETVGRQPASSRSTSVDESPIDLLKSMDTDADASSDTHRHNTVASTDVVQNTYVRSKGDVQYVTVPLGHVWLAGDNMANSTDSRHYGPVPLGMVRGKVLARVYPNPRWLGSNLTYVD